MPKHWLISCHAGVEHDKSNSVKNILAGRVPNLIAPQGMEILFYCPDDAQLSMAGGWKLWDMLMHGESGGEAAAYAAAYKKARPGSRLSNLKAVMDTSDFNHWDDGPHRSPAHPLVNTYGIWEVGNIAAPAIDLKHHPNGLTLAQILGHAIFAGVTRIYWGCCKVHVKATGQLTKASANVHTPPGLL
jgi:hypothetical protein